VIKSSGVIHLTPPELIRSNNPGNGGQRPSRQTQSPPDECRRWTKGSMTKRATFPSGRFMKVSGIALLAAGGLLYAVLGGPDDNSSALVGALLMPGGMFAYFRGRRQAAKVIATDSNNQAPAEKASVLYLRSFKSDTSTPFKTLMSGFTTEEEQLADGLRPFGDMVAIGRPCERLPLPGAARMYATDSEWKSVVLDHLRSASLVVIRAGSGAGLLWEVSHALTTLSPRQIVILVLNLTLDEYRHFADLVHNNTQLTVPEIASCNLKMTIVDFRYNWSKAAPGFIVFADDWSPTFLPLPFTMTRIGYNDLKKAFNLALRPVFERHGVQWHSVGRFGSA
jgi:hypothetical protein